MWCDICDAAFGPYEAWRLHMLDQHPHRMEGTDITELEELKLLPSYSIVTTEMLDPWMKILDWQGPFNRVMSDALMIERFPKVRLLRAGKGRTD